MRLERYALGELPETERDAVAGHLAACPVCNECFASIEQTPVLVLPLLAPPAPKLKPRRALWPGRTAWAGLAAAAAAGLLFMGPVAEPPARLHVKGGDFALELVRLDADDRVQEASNFEATDRFKALITCPPAWRGVVGMVVYQAGKTYTPLPVHALDECGNRRALPGAFKLDGNARALVCASFGSSEAEWRSRIGSANAPPSGSVCTALESSRDKNR
jgi:hypothetical protein